MTCGWNHLKAGDIVDVVATSSAPSDKNIIQDVSDYIKNLGLTPRIPDDLLGEDLFCANTSSDRFQHLKNALVADDSKAVWCLKGGYGIAHLLPMLHDVKPPKTPKILIGFSDITALHIFLNQEWNWPTLHAPMLSQISKNRVEQDSITALHDVLFGKSTELSYELKPLNEIANNHHKIESKVIGGNLSIIQNSLGSFWQIKSENKILLFEDIDESIMRIHRMLTHLDQAHIFDNIAALIFADFTKIIAKENAPSLEEMLADFISEILEKYNIPIFRMQGVGHDTTNFPMPLNTPAAIDKNYITIKTGVDL